MQLFKFIAAAMRAGVAYIDCDGCVLKKFPVPESVSRPYKLLWWKYNLEPTPVVWRRLSLLYFLYFIGVRLVLWTNRDWSHRAVTVLALGKHIRVFSVLRFRGGTKILDRLDGPVMDDDVAYLSCGTGPGLLVKSL
jgi:hypothetical protein